MSGYYPEGVTGNEYEIAGATHEDTAERNVYCNNEDCTEFENETWADVNLESYGTREWGTWKCRHCGEMQDYEAEREYDDVDPDAAYDRMKEDW